MSGFPDCVIYLLRWLLILIAEAISIAMFCPVTLVGFGVIVLISFFLLGLSFKPFDFVILFCSNRLFLYASLKIAMSFFIGAFRVGRALFESFALLYELGKKYE